MLGLRNLRGRWSLPAAMAALALLGAVLPSGIASADDVDGVLGDAPSLEVSKSVEDPVTLEPGLWSDVLEPAPSNPHQFVYERHVNQSTVHISVVGLLGPGDGVQISTRAGRVADCGNASFEGTSTAGWSRRPVGSRVTVANTNLSDECMLQAVPLQIQVGRQSSSTVADDVPIRIKVVEEAPLRNPTDADEGGRLPAPPDWDEPFVAPSTGDAEAVEPGFGFDDAVELASGTVSATVEPGKPHFYRVPLSWGQTVAAQFEAEPLERTDPESTVWSGPEVQLEVADPLRNTIDSNLDDAEPRITTEFEDPDDYVEPAIATTGFGPIVWRDRTSNRVAYLPGDHWIIVTAKEEDDEARRVPVPYTLSVEVQGEKVAAPEYEGKAAGFLIGPDTWSSSASGHTAPLDGDETWLTGRRGAGMGLVAGGLVCLALGVWQVRRPRT